MDAAAVRDRAADLPADPGVYQFHAEDPLYVGKAVDLRERVRSYADPRSARVARMVERADRIEVAVTETETQALLLEANLIKRHQPRYNVRLKDDKSYPLVQLTDHPAPRIEVTRDPDEGATVFGPYTDRGEVETVVKALRETYGLRGCSDHKYANRDRPCLDHDVGLCSAPCTDEIDAEAYRTDASAARRFLEGETGVLADPLRRAMAEAAEAERFERAANLRDRLRVVEAFHRDGGDAVAAGERGDGGAVDVLGAAVEGNRATVARLHAEAGKLVDRSRHRLDVDDGATPAAVLAAFVPQFYADRALPDTVLCSERIPDDEVRTWLADRGVDLRVPGAGREARLVDLALRNARRDETDTDPCAALASALGLPAADRIEGVDVSHTGGDETVGANVCFVDGSAERSAYRRVRLDDANDDPGSVGALVRWRAERAVEGRDDRPDPDLLVVDGGREQLAAARDALDDAGWDVPAVAIAKSDERVLTPETTHRWPADAPHRHLCQRVRDEAHRFAVQYHRTLRDEVSTVLDEVEGVGPTLRRRLLGRFGSVGNVRDASREELLAVDGVGARTADRLVERL